MKLFYTERNIEKIKQQLNKSIEKTGLNSKETREISTKLDELMNKYYNTNVKYEEGNRIKMEYDVSYEALKKVTKDFGEFPTTRAWNKYAKENSLLNHVSMQYISGLDWNKLRVRVFYEIN